MCKDKVSIIIPAYNVENYLFRGIESALNQTYENIEVVIVDDGSTDRTWEVIQSYAQKDSRVVAEQQANAGVSAARNHALRLATGKYVIFLDSDDWLEPDTVQVLTENTEPGKNMLISADCYFACFNQKQEIERESDVCGQPAATLPRNEILTYINKDTYKIRSSCYKLFSMDVIRENHMQFEENIHHGEDGLFVFRYLCMVDAFKYVPKPLWNILDRPHSATTGKYNAKWLTAMDAVRKMMECPGIPDEVLNLLRAYLVDRILVVERTAIVTDPGNRKDIRFLRKNLRACYKDFFLVERTKKARLYIFAMAYMPIFMLRIAHKLFL